MLNQPLKQCLAFLLSICIAYMPFVQAAQLSLPAGDSIAPVVKHKKLSDYVVKGQNYSIEATVTDNEAVKSVSLFYRQSGSSAYKRAYMKQVKGTDIYSVTLNKDVLTPPGIEYYIQATDIAGNSLLFGYSFAPLALDVSNEVKQIVNKPLLKPSKEDDEGISKWWWIGLGVLVVAGAAGGGGGGGGGTPSSTGSTVVVSAPLP